MRGWVDGLRAATYGWGTVAAMWAASGRKYLFEFELS